jgi:hypothetical protein
MALIAALSVMAAAASSAVPAAFAVNTADQGDNSFLANIANLHADTGIGSPTQTSNQNIDDPHANLLGQSNVCSLFGGSVAVGC